MKRFTGLWTSYRAEVLLAVAALVLYAAGMHWGWPSGIGPDQVRPWGHDDVMPLGALAELQNTFVHASANRYLGYPLLQYLIVAAAYSPYLMVLFATAGMSYPNAVYPHGLAGTLRAFEVLALV